MADSTQETTQSSAEKPLDDSQTASEFINSQLKLEADAREALPYSFDHCTQPLGPLRQNIFSCITCNPPPKSDSDPYTAAGICYSCSIACHSEHTLVELFAHRNFVCDCGTSRLPDSSPCTLRIDPTTGAKGFVHSQEPAKENTYNQNFRNKFCGCGDWYDAHKQKGTMFQCVGLATEQDGGCGEDWWHPECLLGLPRNWHQSIKATNGAEQQSVANPAEEQVAGEEDEHPVPPGFPDEDEFEALICYRCIEASPRIRRYANTNGFTILSYGKAEPTQLKDEERIATETTSASVAPENPAQGSSLPIQLSKKRKAEDDETDSVTSKKAKVEDEINGEAVKLPIHASLPEARNGKYSLLAKADDFRSLFCRCAECYPTLKNYPQLLEEEETYEPPISEDGEGQGAGSVGTGSLLDRGEAALSNVDRVRAIEGVMVYNHLRDKVKSFLQPFAESGQAVGAEDIKAYFEKLRGDSEAIKAAGGAATANGGGDGDNRREQSGY